MFSVKTVKKAGQKGLSWAKLQRELAKLRKAYVKAGVLGNAQRVAKGGKNAKPAGGAKPAAPGITNAALASIHEYGLGNAPARPWIGPPFRAKRADYLKRLVKAYKQAVQNANASLVERELGRLGLQMVADIKNYVTQGPGVPPPNAPSTIAAKGSSRPLVDTSGMVNSVTHQVVKP